MLRNVWFLARSDFIHLFRRRETWLWAFVLPIVFFYFIGTITSGYARDPSRKDPIAILIPANAGFLADELMHRLDRLGYYTVKVATADEMSKYPAAIAIPPGFTASVLNRIPVNIALQRRGGGLGLDYDQTRVNRAIFGILGDFVLVTEGGTPATPEAFRKLDSEPRGLTLEVRTAGRRKFPPSGFDQSVPGSMVFFVLMVLFTSGGITLIIERDEGILRRLGTSPMSRTAVLLGKFGGRLMLGMVQIAFAMLAGSVLFHVRWGTNLPMVLLVLLAYASFAAGLGMLLGNFARTRGQAGAFAAVCSNVLAAIGGCWWPIELTPPWMQSVARLTPTGLTMDALHQMVNFGAPAVTVLPHVVALFAATAVAGFFVARSFRFQ